MHWTINKNWTIYNMNMKNYRLINIINMCFPQRIKDQLSMMQISPNKTHKAAIIVMKNKKSYNKNLRKQWYRIKNNKKKILTKFQTLMIKSMMKDLWRVKCLTNKWMLEILLILKKTNIWVKSKNKLSKEKPHIKYLKLMKKDWLECKIL